MEVLGVLEGSLAYRTARAGGRWLVLVSRDSLCGRAVAAVARGLRRIAAGSWVLSLRSVEPRSRAADASSLSGRAVSSAYRGLTRRIGSGPIGMALQNAQRAPTGSVFVGRAWLRVVGAAAVGVGVGRLWLLKSSGAPLGAVYLGTEVMGARLILPLVSLLVRGGLLIAGPRVAATAAATRALRGAGSGHGAGLPRSDSFGRGRPAGTVSRAWVTAACVMAAAAGALGGVSAGPLPWLMAAIAVVAILLPILLYRPEVLLLLVAAFPWVDWGARRMLGGLGPAWDELFMAGSFVALAFAVFALRRWDLRTVPLTVPFLLALATGVGSVLVNDVPKDVGIYALRMTFQPVLFFYLGYWLPKSERWVKLTVVAFVLASLLLATHGLWQYVTHAPMPARWRDVREIGLLGTRAYSIVENPNGLAAFLLMGCLLTASLALGRLRTRSRVMWGCACAVLLAGVAVTFSRGAWLALAVGAAGMALLAYRRMLVWMVGAVTAAYFVAPQAFIGRLTFAFNSAYITKSMEAGRLFVWKLALERIVDHPWFGIGLGTFGGTSAVLFSYSRLWIDNFYLQLAAEGGLVLLFMFLWILVRAGKGVLATYLRAGTAYSRAVAAGVFGGLIAVICANLTTSAWETLIVGAGFWFLAGFTSSLGGLEGTGPSRTARTGGHV